MRYYTINEEQAKQARQMWSFSDYQTGSKTAEYKAQVDEVYKMVESLPDELKERGEAIADRYARRLAEWYNKQFRIELMCPSVMICGAGNFPVRKKQKQNEAQDRHYKLYEEIQAIPNKIRQLKNGTNIIKAGDKDAIEQLQKKLERAEALQKEMKACNAYYRKHKTLAGYKKYGEDEYTTQEAEEIDEAIKNSFYGVPFAPYQLSNNNAKIRNIKARIKQIESIKEQAQSNENGEDDILQGLPFKVIENGEIMRLQIFFDDKPDADTRSVLKKNGFRFAPSQGNAWQRQLNENSKHSLNIVIKQLQNIQKTD